MTLLRVEGTTIAVRDPSGGRRLVLTDLRLEVASGEIVGILGPSGCGKTTLLRTIAGYHPVLKGQITWNGTRIASPGTDRGFVPQDYSLYPWLTAAENISFGASARRQLDATARHTLVATLLDRVGLADKGQSFPRQLSGGQRQRIALARAVAANPNVLLLDEPFGALDAPTKMKVQAYLVSLIMSSNIATMLVTHDVEEAVRLCDRVYVIAGRPSSVVKTLQVPSPRSAMETLTLRGEHAQLADVAYLSLAEHCND